MKIRLFEIFTSVEGEGILFGTKTLFVRLAGCPFTCFYCDTKESLPLDSGTEYTIEEASQLINTNLKSAYNFCKNVITTMMRQKDGSILNITSISGVSGTAGQVNCTSSQAGLIGMTKALAKEVGKININVNAIACGFVETDMTAVLPEEYSDKSFEEHAAFWQGKDVPDSWYKFRDIAHYWIDKGVDGFRYDMAEMVPVEFWSFLNSSIKQKAPNAFLLAEVYQPDKYREYIHQGKMDYLYDKVGFYDTLKTIMQGSGEVSKLVTIHDEINDIAPHMLHFLENHDEQRIASPDFAGSAQKGKPALAVSALISSSPTLLYFGQDVGEDGSEETGFGDPTRTSIFDYVGVPAHQRFMNDGKFDAGKSTEDEKALHQFYQDVMAIAATNPAVTGEYQSLHALNLDVKDSAYTEQQFAFVRAQGEHGFVVVANFNDKPTGAMKLVVPSNVLGKDSDRITLAPMLSHEGITLEKAGINYNASFSLEGLETKVFAF
mgnify:CR=1 FL=1